MIRWSFGLASVRRTFAFAAAPLLFFAIFCELTMAYLLLRRLCRGFPGATTLHAYQLEVAASICGLGLVQNGGDWVEIACRHPLKSVVVVVAATQFCPIQPLSHPSLPSITPCASQEDICGLEFWSLSFEMGIFGVCVTFLAQSKTKLSKQTRPRIQR